jgi:hypothetical protein
MAPRLPGHVTIENRIIPCITVFLVQRKSGMSEVIAPVYITNYDLNEAGLNERIEDKKYLRECFMNPSLYTESYPRAEHIESLFNKVQECKDIDVGDAATLVVGAKGYVYQIIFVAMAA